MDVLRISFYISYIVTYVLPWLWNKHARVVVGSRFPPSCERTDPIRCIHPRSGALFGQSMALDGLHKVRKTGAPGMGPYPKRTKCKRRVLEQDRNETAQTLEEFETLLKNAKNNGQVSQVTQINPLACHPKELQRKHPCFASGALLCWPPQSAYCAPE